MTPEEIKSIVAKVYSGEYQYEQLRESKPFGLDLPPWSDLTEEQKNNVKEEQIRFSKEMNALGERIASKGL